MNIFVADIGQGKAHFYDSGADKFYGKMNDVDLININIPGIKNGDCIVVEDAHLRESHKNTLAQPFSYEQLEEFDKNAAHIGITVLVFPQKSTPKARKLAGVDADAKTDEADTRAIASFLNNDVEAFRCLKEFTPNRLIDYQEENQHIFEYVQQVNEDINPAKSSEYGLGKIDYQDEVSKWIKKYAVKGGMTVYGHVPSICEYLNYDEELLKAIGIAFGKKGQVLKIQTPNRLYTIVNSILRPNGELRLRSDIQKPPYWKFVKEHYFGLKPFHMNQGVAASNYKHWMRPAVSEYTNKAKKDPKSSDFMIGMSYDEYFALKEARTKVDKMTQQIWYALRKMIVEDGFR
jgi:hypothetical protein